MSEFISLYNYQSFLSITYVNFVKWIFRTNANAHITSVKAVLLNLQIVLN